MMKSRKYIKRKQRKLNKMFKFWVSMNMIIAFSIMMFYMVKECENNQIEGVNNEAVNEFENDYHDAVIQPANVLPDPKDNSLDDKEKTVIDNCRGISEEDQYLLAKIAMAEAECESFETKVLVIETILNRKKSDEFPNTIEEVIFQKVNGVYQFSPVMPGGRWWKVEPNDECWDAVNYVNDISNYDETISSAPLFFESCTGESWHSRNLEFVFKSGNMRFYK